MDRSAYTYSQVYAPHRSYDQMVRDVNPIGTLNRPLYVAPAYSITVDPDPYGIRAFQSVK